VRETDPLDALADEPLGLEAFGRPRKLRFRAAAGGRGMTHAQYVAALVALHEAMRALADSGNETVDAELGKLGLSTVSV
jgi:hypothetical protein